jgi:hypothetical protein
MKFNPPSAERFNSGNSVFLSAARQIGFFWFLQETGKLRNPINPVNPVYFFFLRSNPFRQYL